MWRSASLRFCFAFPWLLVILIIIWHACWSFMDLLWKKCIFKLFAHILTELFVFLLLSHGSSFHIMNAKSLLSIWTTNNFSHCVDCLFTFWLMGFDTQKFLILIKVNLLFCFFFLLKEKLMLLVSFLEFHCQIQDYDSLWLWTRRRSFVVTTSTLAFLSTYTESKDQPEGKLRALLECFLGMFPVLSICVAF